MEIGETKTISHLGSDKQRVVRLLEKRELTKGTRSGKEIWKLAFLGINHNTKKEREISLIRRQLDLPKIFRGNKTNTEYFTYIWTALKKAGIPVIPTIVVLSDDEILETNYKSLGSGIYGKDSWGKDKKEQTTDSYMLNINLEEVRNRALVLAEIASNNNILLSHDHAFDLIIQHDGSWDVVARDIKNTRVLSDDNSSEEIRGKNLEVANRLVDFHLTRSQEELVNNLT